MFVSVIFKFLRDIDNLCTHLYMYVQTCMGWKSEYVIIYYSRYQKDNMSNWGSMHGHAAVSYIEYVSFLWLLGLSDKSQGNICGL